MKKTAYILAAALLIGALSGCSGNKTPDSTKENGKVTQVAVPEIQKNNTTNEALEYLRTQVPLFAKYVEKRNSIPLTYEVEITTEEGTQTASINIRNEKSVSFLATDVYGNHSGTIYTDNMCYVISEEEKTVYHSKVTEATCKELVTVNQMNISVTDAHLFSYETDLDYYNDVLYKHEVINISPDEATHYYFDQQTDELVYIVTGNQVTKITRFQNEVNESAFEIPSDYKSVDLNEYVNGTIDSEKQADEAE